MMETVDINSMSDEDYLQLLKSRSGNTPSGNLPDDTVILTDSNGRGWTWGEVREGVLEKVRALKV